MRINIKVVAGASKNRIVKKVGFLKVYITQPALEGRANKRLIELIAEHLHIKKYNISIVRGEHNREKVLEIREYR